VVLLKDCVNAYLASKEDLCSATDQAGQAKITTIFDALAAHVTVYCQHFLESIPSHNSRSPSLHRYRLRQLLSVDQHMITPL
jgi:hypothetical protein